MKIYTHTDSETKKTKTFQTYREAFAYIKSLSGKKWRLEKSHIVKGDE